MVWDRKRVVQTENSRKANVGLRFSGEKIRASVVLSYWLNELLTYRVNNVRHSATRSIRIWIYRWYSARRRCLFSLFAGTVFQERHCVPVPLRMCRYGKRGQLSLQGCKPPYCNYRIPVCFALSRIPLKLRSCKEPLFLVCGCKGRNYFWITKTFARKKYSFLLLFVIG